MLVLQPRASSEELKPKHHFPRIGWDLIKLVLQVYPSMTVRMQDMC